MRKIAEEETYTFERGFTKEGVRRFAEISRDTHLRHTETDDEGRLMVHGLLTATMPTKIGTPARRFSASGQTRLSRAS